MWGHGNDWSMMGGLGGETWWGPFQMIIWPLILVALVAGIIWFIRSQSYARAGRSSGLDILEERYARGEINRDEFLQKKQEIAG